MTHRTHRFARSPLVLALAFLTTAGLIPMWAADAVELTMEERIACRQAVEEVYWRHRQPSSEVAARSAGSSVLPIDRGEIQRRVLNGLLWSDALSVLWHDPVSDEDLQREISRMARDTRRPEMLAELWQVLDDEPVRVAECLARPLLAERRARQHYARDRRFHGELESTAQAELAAVRSGGAVQEAQHREVEWFQAGGGEVTVDDVRPVGALDAAAWRSTLEQLASDLGRPLSEASQKWPAGIYGPLREADDRFYAVAVVEAEPGRVRLERLEWMKLPFEQWWGDARLRFSADLSLDRSGSSDLALPTLEVTAGCATDTWQPTAALPSGRRDQIAVWTGSEMLMWAGTAGFSAGARYDPATDSWRPMSIVGQPNPARSHATGVWTGSELLVWGGWGFLASDNTLSDGGAYDPASDSWRSLPSLGAPSKRTEHTAVWSGDEMIVWGGWADLSCSSRRGDGARYSPATDAWVPLTGSGAPLSRGQHSAVWTGSEMIVWGGCGGASICSGGLASGGRYDPVTDSWAAVRTTGAPGARRQHSAVWTGNQMIVWGGETAGLLASGGRYDPATDSWAATDETGAPSARRFHSAVWADGPGVMIVWGGCVDAQCSQSRSDGGRYDPLTDSWQTTTTTGAALASSHHRAVWTGSEMIVWGGCNGGECQINHATGGRYDPLLDSWAWTLDPREPGSRTGHTAVWTGAEMIVYGGYQSGVGISLTGGRYDPATDSWQWTAVNGYAGARSGHTAVWTGDRMIVWGGVMPSVGSTASGAAYDPTLDQWVVLPSTGAPAARTYHTAVWTGTEMIVWGGCGDGSCNQLRADGGAFEPGSGTWRGLATSGQPVPRVLHTAVWTGSEMVVWGGTSGSSFGSLASGGAYDPLSDSWAPTDQAGAPSARSGHTAVWAAGRMIVWGGSAGGANTASGGRYDPLLDHWQPTALSGVPTPRHGHVAVSTGDQMIVWGGCEATLCDGFNPESVTASGARYRPAADSWSETSLVSAPMGRDLASAVWTGQEMVVWAGVRGSNRTSTGGRYCLAVPQPIFRDGFESGGLGRWVSASAP